LSQCNHVNIVKYHCAYLNINQKKGIEEVWIICEFVTGGSLSEAAKIHLFKDKHIAYIALQMCLGLKYIHDRKWAHRDLKSANVMIKTDGSIKLIDFGLCADVSQGDKRKMLGSAFWIPPEMIRKETHSLSADIWSLAVCILELYLQSPPHAISPLKCMFEVATVGLVGCIPDFASDEARDWLMRCLIMDKTKRATVDELLMHPWVNGRSVVREFVAVLRGLFLVHTLDAIM